jgi:hypothetical protein
MNLTEELIQKLDDLDCLTHLECDGMTRVVSYLLTENGVKHSVCTGSLTVKGLPLNRAKGTRIDLHWWVDLGMDWIIDYRARMWLGKHRLIPHGVFSTKTSPEARYRATQRIQLHVPKFIFDILAQPVPENLPDEIECAKQEAHRPL